MSKHQQLANLLQQVRACRICESALVDGVRPVVQVHSKARILIAGQAPGRKVHESGVAFNDASGDRLRQWMGVSSEVFYDPEKVAILPMGFCFPGTGKNGDLPPRAECIAAWREQLMTYLPNIKLTLVIGQYAQAYYYKQGLLTNTSSIAAQKSVTETVKNWQHCQSGVIPLPHPSPRNNIWLKRNPWFETELLPQLRHQVKAALI